MPPVIIGSLLLIGLALISAALGRRLLLWGRVPIADPFERGLFACALGVGALQALPFALLSLGIGRPPAMRIAILILAVLLLSDLRAVVLRCIRAIQSQSLHDIPVAAREPGIEMPGWEALCADRPAGRNST